MRQVEAPQCPCADVRTCVLDPGWRGEVLQAACGLVTLALLAITAHGRHISAHSLPDETCRDYPLGSTNARVGHTVNGLEHRWPVHLWHQGPCDASCHVMGACPLDLDSPHYQGGGLTGLQRATILLKETLGGAAPQTHQLTRHED
jgi:hypothetical protein